MKETHVAVKYLDAAMADRDRLAGIINRAIEQLDYYLDDIPVDRGAPLAISDARATLAEADPSNLGPEKLLGLLGPEEPG